MGGQSIRRTSSHCPGHVTTRTPTGRSHDQSGDPALVEPPVVRLQLDLPDDSAVCVLFTSHQTALSLSVCVLFSHCSHCMQQILESVNYCHQMGIVHRDLKVGTTAPLLVLLFTFFLLFLSLLPLLLLPVPLFSTLWPAIHTVSTL